MDLSMADLVARWVHLLAVVVWVGHNYANVVQRPNFDPIASEDPPEAARYMFQAALKREHAVFRYASLVAWASGLFMLWNRGLLIDAFTLSGEAAVIGIGAWTGTAMMLNVWLLLWPHQKKVLGFAPATVDERLRCARITFLTSRTNTIQPGRGRTPGGTWLGRVVGDDPPLGSEVRPRDRVAAQEIAAEALFAMASRRNGHADWRTTHLRLERGRRRRRGSRRARPAAPRPQGGNAVAAQAPQNAWLRPDGARHGQAAVLCRGVPRSWFGAAPRARVAAE